MTASAAARGSWFGPFVLLGAIWGCSFMFIKVCLRAMAPVQVAFGRLAVGAAVLLIYLTVRRIPLPRSREVWGRLFVMGILLNSVPFTLFAFAETHVGSALAGIINGATPLTALVAVMVAFPEERPTRERVAGLMIGFVGVLMVLGVWEGFAASAWLGASACVGAVCFYGVSYPYSRRHLTNRPEPAASLAAGQVTCAAVQLLPFAVFAGAPHGPFTSVVWLSLLLLGALGSGLAYVLNYAIIRLAGSTAASTVTYLPPLFAVVVGTLLLGEHLRWYEPAGAVVVLLGVAVGQGRLGGLIRRDSCEVTAA